MNDLPKAAAANSLEPADWDQFRALGRKMVDDMAGYLESLRDRPVWRPMPDAVQAQLREPLPLEGMGAESAYAEFCRSILPFPRGNIHPRFWGWVNGSGVPLAAYADFLASVMNGTVSSSESAAMHVEDQVLRWLKHMFDWPETGSGLLTSGCSMGQIIAIAAARVARTRWDVRSEGALGGPQLTVYCSRETHLSVQKAVELLGLGSAHLRLISVTADHEIDVDELERTIRADQKEGFLPICIVGNVGTVNTGAIDPISDLLRIARREGLWLHVDGAFGAFAYLLPSHRKLLAALKEADSLVFDLHKWFFMPFDVSCILVRDPSILEGTFGVPSAYTSKTASGPASCAISFADRGIEQTRSFRALKVWFALKSLGLTSFTETIRRNIDQIRYLNEKIDRCPSLERFSKSLLNVTCFRYVQPGMDKARLNEVNRTILGRLQERGLAVPSHTIIDGNFLIRVANNNHRTDYEDFDFLVRHVLSFGDELARSESVDHESR